MESLERVESIRTEMWSNIPGCLVKAINVIVEHVKSSYMEQGEIKAALGELSGKFTAKTSRYDASIADTSNTLQSFSGWAASEIGVLKTKMEESRQGIDNKIKSLTDIVHESKTKYTSFYGEFRKETRDISSKLEALKNKTETTLDENFENAKKLIDYCNNSLTKKIIAITTESRENTEANAAMLKIFNEFAEENKQKVSIHQEQIKINHENIGRISQDCFNFKEKLEKLDGQFLNLSSQVDSLILATTIIPSVQDTPSESNENKHETAFFNPVIEKLSELEENLHKVEANYKKALKSLEYDSNLDLINLKNSIEHWTKDQILNALNEKFSKISSKLEWLPDKSDNIKGMSATEARLFLIESRIRGEERARILSDQKLRSDLTGIKEISSTKSSNNKRIAFSPNETKVINIEFNTNKPRRVRPYSSLHRRERNSKDKLLEKFVVRTNDHSVASYNVPI